MDEKDLDIQEIVTRVEASDNFRKFLRDNPDNYLAHLFNMSDNIENNDWQLGYYGKKSDKITVFDMLDNGNISVMPPQDAFKENNYIQPLDMGKIKVSRQQAHDSVVKVLKDNYSAELANKMIMLLQNLPEYGQLWNCTVITATFSVLNVKINAETGELIKHSKESLLGWKKE
jgi:hypothetical protein